MQEKAQPNELPPLLQLQVPISANSRYQGELLAEFSVLENVLLPVRVIPGLTALCTVLSVRFFRREQRFDSGSITPFSLTDRKEIFIIYNSAASMNIQFIRRITLWECRLQH